MSMNFTMVLTENEDANGNPNPSVISNAVNNGVSLFNYTGHGDLNTCITGNFLYLI